MSQEDMPPCGLWFVAVAALSAAIGPRALGALPVISPSTNGIASIRVEAWPSLTNLVLQAPAANLVSIHLLQGRQRTALPWSFNPDATGLQVELPTVAPAQLPVQILLESGETTTQFPDGRIVFSALDATVHGAKAKLESQPGNHRIISWTDPTDSVSWQYKPTRWGTYDVELTYSADGGQGTQLEIEVADRHLAMTRASTGDWARYTTVPVGRIYLAKPEPLTVRVRCKTGRGIAVLNLKALTLRPAPEGRPIVQEPSGAVSLAARDAITHSTVLRYEPATNKNCLGFWTNPRDWAEWEFTVTHPGTFEVEVWQGCGKGNGGSEVLVEAGTTRLNFTVEETGHFQKFIARRIGRVQLPTAGPHTLAIRPVHKKAAAIMDIREVRLLPVARGP